MLKKAICCALSNLIGTVFDVMFLAKNFWSNLSLNVLINHVLIKMCIFLTYLHPCYRLFCIVTKKINCLKGALCFLCYITLCMICPNYNFNLFLLLQPKACKYCLVKAAFKEKTCARCTSSEKKYGPPKKCQGCGLMAAFQKNQESQAKVM